MSKITNLFCVVAIFAILSIAASFTEAGFHTFDIKRVLSQKNQATFTNPPNPAPSNSNVTSQFPSLALLEALNKAIVTKNVAALNTIIANDAQIFMPGMGDFLFGKQTFINMLQGLFQQYSTADVNFYVQTLAPEAATVEWIFSYVLIPQYMNVSNNQWMYETFRHVQLRTTADKTQIAYLSAISNGAESVPANASITAATVVNFLQSWESFDLSRIMAFFNSSVTLTVYPLGADPNVPNICNYACIQNLFTRRMAEVVDKKLVVRSDARLQFVNFNIQAISRKSFAYVQVPSNPSEIFGFIDVATEVFEFDPNFKIIKWTAYVSREGNK